MDNQINPICFSPVTGYLEILLNIELNLTFTSSKLVKISQQKDM